MTRATILLISVLILVPLFGDELPTTQQSLPMPNQAAVEEAQQQVRTMKVWKMTEVLDLSAAQEVEFFKLFNQLEDLQQKHLEAKRQLVSKMAEVLDSNSSDINIYAQMIDQYQGMDSDFKSQEQNILVKITKVLNFKQQVAFLIVEETFTEDVRRAIAAERWKVRQNQMMETKSAGSTTVK